MGDIANIYTRIGNIQTQINNVTANTSSNYNQINLALTQQANISATVTSILNNSGSGNLNTGNLFTTGNVRCSRISTASSQLPFRIEYGTTAIVNTDVIVTFSSPFTVAPTVMLTGYTNSSEGPYVYIRSLTTTSALFYAKDRTSSDYGSIQFNWMAIGR